MVTADTRSTTIAKAFLQTVIMVDDLAELGRAEGSQKEEIPGPSLADVDSTFVAGPENEDPEPSAGLVSPGDNVRPGPEGGDENLDAKLVIDRFSELGLVCAVMRPDASDDIVKTVGTAAGRADILVLDWWLHGDGGAKSLDIIRHVVSDIDQRHRVRLIVIYTAGRDLEGIAKQIAMALGDPEGVEGHRVATGPIHVTVLAKPETNVDSEFAGAVVEFRDLPDRVIAEFVLAVRGLLPNVVLSSIAAIRNNTHRILNRFSKDLDAAYLGHRMLLPHPDDAEEHLTSLVAQELSSVLDDAQVGSAADTESVASLVSESVLLARSIDPITTLAAGKSLTVEDYALELVRHGIEWPGSGLSRDKREKAHNWSTGIYSSDEAGAREIELRFAALMQTRSRYENPVPHLGLGVFIMDSESEQFYLCMQPVCDSARLESDTAFPFLPLNEVNKGGGFDFVLPSNGQLRSFKMRLKLRDIRMQTFQPGAHPPGIVAGVRSDDGNAWLFKTVGEEGSSFAWVGELRDGWAHHYANKFADEASRVGVDDSEWARRSKSRQHTRFITTKS
jgi:hypothetical protein